jgi:murein hydrolase activator
MVVPCCPEPRGGPPRRAGRRAVRAGWCAGLGLALCATAMGATRAGEHVRSREMSDAKRIAEASRLKRIRAEIDDLKERLSRTEARAGSVLDAIDEIGMRIALLGGEAESLRAQQSVAEEREAAAQAEADATSARLQRSEQDLAVWLRQVYKIGPTRYLRVVAASSSPAEVAAGQRAVEALSLSEGRRIDAFRDDQSRLDAALQEIREQQAVLDGLGQQILDKDRDLREARRHQQAVLYSLKREQATQKRTLLELEEVERNIRALLESLNRPHSGVPAPSTGFARAKGRLAWPAEGRLAIPFGNVRHPRFSTEVPHPGIDIAAEVGKDVRAVFDGRVVFSNWFKGYGQMIVLDHGDGYLSIYGHVSDRLAEVGDDVRQGEAIAHCGEGGSFDTPGLYFEIRHDGRPEDPSRWLRAAGARPGAPAAGKPRATRDGHTTHGGGGRS